MSKPSAGVGACIIPFPPERWIGRRLSAHDRSEAAAWELAMLGRCFAQVTCHVGPAEGGDEDMLLVYCGGMLWTIRAAGPPGRRLELRRRPDGTLLGAFATMREALDHVMPSARIAGSERVGGAERERPAPASESRVR